MSKNGFLSGVLTINGGMQHSIFEIEIKKKSGKAPVSNLYTCDVPPIPIQNPNDEFHVAFHFENCTNLSEPTCVPIIEEIFKASAIDSSLPGEQCAIRTENGEWQFMRRKTDLSSDAITPWFLTEIQLKVNETPIRQYM